MPKKYNERLQKMIVSALTEKTFCNEVGISKQKMEQMLKEEEFVKVVEKLYDSVAGEGGRLCRFSAVQVAEILEPFMSKLSDKPEEGWSQHSYRYILNRLFPDKSQDFQSKKYGKARLVYLKTLQTLFKYERRNLPYDPTVDIILLNAKTIDEQGYNREYKRFLKVTQGNYIYEFMRLGIELTSFNTLGHIAGVHHVAMYMAKQLVKVNVPCDLGLVSGASVCHDIGKYGCKKGEEKRVPYLHYYYTDVCTERFNMPLIGHIASNHSTWDLELENLSVESLLLIYADFRVKSSRDENGNEVVNFYTLKDAFQVILDKLDNVDSAKELRYRKVYNKLRDFENYIRRLGVDTEIKGVASEIQAPEIEQRPYYEMASLSRNEIVEAIKWTAIDHNVRLMNKFYSEEEFGNLLEAARGEKQWRNLRTYIDIFGEYSTYMTEKQKLQTIRLLYEMLTHRESDIRYQAGEILGQIIAKFNIEYRKELPQGVKLSKKKINNITLWKKIVEGMLFPDSKLTDEHRKRIGYTLKNVVVQLLERCDESLKESFVDVIISWCNRRELSDENKAALLRVATAVNPDDFTPKQKKAMIAFANRSMKEEALNLRIAGAKVRECFGLDSRQQYIRTLQMLESVSAIESEEGLSEMFLDDLKARTHWSIKAANITVMLDYLDRCGDEGTALHVATHLANLIKVSETITVRAAAGNGLLKIIDRLLPEQRNEIAVELGKGLEIGDYQFSKYIPNYLGKIMLHLPPSELDELIADLVVFLNQTNAQVASSVLHTFGVMLENYNIYREHYGDMESEEVTNSRKLRILNYIIKGFGDYIPEISLEAIWTIGVHIFASRELSLQEKFNIFRHSSKKVMTIYENKREGELDFFNNAAAFRHLYDFICTYEIEVGDFDLKDSEKVAFFPGTFDPFSVSHKAIAKEICARGFEVYLALDEFSWSKKTQPRLQRRKIMSMSIADEENMFLIPDNISINIANTGDIKKLKNIFKGRDLYFVAGSDVIDNASCYRADPSADSIHTLNHIVFKRESNEVGQGLVSPDKERYPIEGEIINLSLEKIYEDVSSTRIRDNIDLNRDISNLIDPVAQNYIFDRSLYMREPAYKHVIQARDISLESLGNRDASSLDDLKNELNQRGYDVKKIREYLDREDVEVLCIRDGARSGKVVALAAVNKLDSFDLLKEFGNPKIAEYIRSQAAGAIAVIGGFFYSRNTSISSIEQTLLIEILSELIKRDYTYVVYNPCEKAGKNKRISVALMKQGFINIASDDEQPIYAVNMKKPIIIFKNVSTTIKSPLNENPRVLSMVETAHDRLLQQLTQMYPGELILSYNAGIMHHKMINLLTSINDVPTTPREKKIYGRNMAVPFGKFLENNVVPNTVTKSLHTEKYYNTEITNFTIEESRHYSPLDVQIKTIKSFNRPVILVDDLLNRGYRMSKIDPILKANNVEVADTVLGVLTGSGKDLAAMKNRKVDSAYYVPNLRLWLDERSQYPYLGGDSIKNPEDNVNDQRAIAGLNMILPYAVPTFLGNLSGSRMYDYSMVCLENARDILHVLEEEYQNVFEKKLTLNRLAEVVASPKMIEVGRNLECDESVAPSVHVERDIERLIRLKGMFK